MIRGYAPRGDLILPGILPLFVSVDSLRRECRQANGKVLRAARFRRAVTHPFAWFSDNGLPCSDLQDPGFVLDLDHSRQHEGELFKLWTLTRLGPSGRALHVRDADAVAAVVDPADVFQDCFRRVASGFDLSRRGDELRHLLLDQAEQLFNEHCRRI